jgi:predicted nucleotidyltransferase component of viral defense system
MSQPNEGLAASVRQRLLNIAEKRGENYNLILRRYVLERFLYRLGASPHRSALILKGAMLFQVWSQTQIRATKDMDFLAQGQFDEVTVTKMVQDICTASAEDDAVEFDLSKLEVSDIREDDRYGGLRARFTAVIGGAKIPVQIDIGIGDVVTPEPAAIDYPTLLPMEPPNVLGYPRETVVAEKLEVIVDLGINNSRLKDYFDLWFLFITFDDHLEMLALAVKRTFAHRGQVIPMEVPVGLSDEFANDPHKQKQWESFVRRSVGEAPDLVEVIAVIREVAMGVFAMARL